MVLLPFCCGGGQSCIGVVLIFLHCAFRHKFPHFPRDLPFFVLSITSPHWEKKHGTFPWSAGWVLSHLFDPPHKQKSSRRASRLTLYPCDFSQIPVSSIPLRFITNLPALRSRSSATFAKRSSCGRASFAPTSPDISRPLFLPTHLFRRRQQPRILSPDSIDMLVSRIRCSVWAPLERPIFFADSTILRLCVAKKNPQKWQGLTRRFAIKLKLVPGSFRSIFCVFHFQFWFIKNSPWYFLSNGQNPYQSYRFCPMNNFQKGTLETILEWLSQNSSPTLMETAGRGSGFRGIAGREVC